MDLSRARVHIAMLNSFRSNLEMNLAVCHDKCQIDYSYSFNSIRYSVLDHFLLSGTLYSKSVDRVTALHDIENMSDHEPIVLDLNMNIHCVGFQDRIYTPRASWVKATDNNLCDYKATLSVHYLNSICQLMFCYVLISTVVIHHIYNV
jgi:hypothetical protein